MYPEDEERKAVDPCKTFAKQWHLNSDILINEHYSYTKTTECINCHLGTLETRDHIHPDIGQVIIGFDLLPFSCVHVTVDKTFVTFAENSLNEHVNLAVLYIYIYII